MQKSVDCYNYIIPLLNIYFYSGILQDEKINSWRDDESTYKDISSKITTLMNELTPICSNSSNSNSDTQFQYLFTFNTNLYMHIQFISRT